MATVDVLVPTYNRSGMLRRSLESIQAQTYSDIEVTIGDDCSDDDTRTIWGNNINGLLARYGTGTGVVSQLLTHFRAHPFNPIGLMDAASVDPSLAGQIIGDVGPVNYLLRSGAVLLCSVYAGLWLFLQSAIGNRRTAVWLWLIILTFELGFSMLDTPRLLLLMTIIGISLGGLYKSSPMSHVTHGEP